MPPSEAELRQHNIHWSAFVENAAQCKSGLAEKYVIIVRDMYDDSTTAVRCAVGVTEGFEVKVGLHQGSDLSPCLFAMMMDRMTDEIREEAPWTMLFADDIVICSESKEHVEEKLESWRYALERRGMKVNRRKTEYMCVNERQDNSSGTVKTQGEEVAKVEDFKYLDSTVQSNGECGREVKKRLQAGWNGWRRMSGVICDRRVPARVKGKVYKVAVRPAMLYGLETIRGADEKTGGGDGGGRVEDVAIFIRSDTNGQYQERVHQRDSTGGKVWRENTRGKTEMVWTPSEER